MECMCLRVKNVDFEQSPISLREGKGKKDRAAMLPASLAHPLKEQIADVRKLHEQDVSQGYGSVELPFALARKNPNENGELGWQHIFPLDRLSIDPHSGIILRHHFDPSGLQSAVMSAANLARHYMPVSPHTFRHCFAPISWKPGMTLARCRSSLGMKIFLV